MTLPGKSPTFSVTTNSKGHLPDGTWSGTMYFVIRGHLQCHSISASGRKWPQRQVTASGRRGQVAASDRKWPQVTASGRRGQVAASDRKWPQRASGRKWPLLAIGREWPQVAAFGKWPPFPISNSTPNATPLECSGMSGMEYEVLILVDLSRDESRDIDLSQVGTYLL